MHDKSVTVRMLVQMVMCQLSDSTSDSMSHAICQTKPGRASILYKKLLQLAMSKVSASGNFLIARIL